MLSFNFGPNNKCLRRDNISKMERGVTIGFLDLKMKNQNRTKQGRFKLVWFGSKPNQTSSNTSSVWTIGFVGFVRTTYTPSREAYSSRHIFFVQLL